MVLDIRVKDSGTPGVPVMKFRKPGQTANPRERLILPNEAGVTNSRTVEVELTSNKELEYRVKVSGVFIYKISLLGWVFGS